MNQAQAQAQDQTPVPFSVYIPRMSVYWTEQDVKNIMYDTWMGDVSYVDFVSICQKPGFLTENTVNQQFKSAFVHFNDYRDLHFVVRQAIDVENPKPYKLEISPTEYWMLLKNKNPVPRTWMNIHQVVDNCRMLETAQTKMDTRQEKMADVIQTMQIQIMRLENALAKLESAAEVE